MNQKIDNILSLYGLRRKAGFNKSADMDTVYAYHFLSRFLTPFDQWPAYQMGVIDKDGNILVSRRDMSVDQENCFTKLDLIVLRMKKAFERTPQGTFLNRMPAQTIASMILKESEVPTNVVGTGQIAQKDILLTKKVIRRKLPQNQENSRDGNN